MYFNYEWIIYDCYISSYQVQNGTLTAYEIDDDWTAI